MSSGFNPRVLARVMDRRDTPERKRSREMNAYWEREVALDIKYRDEVNAILEANSEEIAKHILTEGPNVYRVENFTAIKGKVIKGGAWGEAGTKNDRQFQFRNDTLGWTFTNRWILIAPDCLVHVHGWSTTTSGTRVSVYIIP